MKELNIRDEIIASSKNDGQWLTKKQICEACKCDEKSFRRFAKDFGKDIDVHRKLICSGKARTYFYTEMILQKFQIWLMKNQVNQGRSNELVKQNTMENLEVGMAANAVMSSGSVEAAEQFAKLLIDRTKQVKENKRLEEENKALQVRNESLQIELDESKEWTTLQKYFDNKGWQTDRKKLSDISKKLGLLGFERRKIYSVEYKNGLWAYRTKNLDEYFFEPEF